MNVPESSADSADRSGPGAWRSMLEGAWRFALVSIAAFAVWAFGGKWFHSHGGDIFLYAASAAVFMSAAGFLMHSLIRGPDRFKRFYAIFVPAFLAYAIAWCAAWFLLRFGSGEWLGAGLGCLAFAAVCGWRFRNARSILSCGLILFVTNSLGYFFGGKLMHVLANSQLAPYSNKTALGIFAKLSWGTLYGLGFGAGIGYAFYAFQKNVRNDRQSA